MVWVKLKHYTILLLSLAFCHCFLSALKEWTTAISFDFAKLESSFINPLHKVCAVLWGGTQYIGGLYRIPWGLSRDIRGMGAQYTGGNQSTLFRTMHSLEFPRPKTYCGWPSTKNHDSQSPNVLSTPHPNL